MEFDFITSWQDANLALDFFEGHNAVFSVSGPVFAAARERLRFCRESLVFASEGIDGRRKIELADHPSTI
jgi:hypothetical protein